MQNLFVDSGLNPPRTLTLMITNKCNLTCVHCWPESGLAADCNHVDREKLLEMIGDFRMLGIEIVCLTGGEPLLHPHWFDIVSFCCEEPGINKVCLQTNATLLTGAHAGKLASLTHHKLRIQVSIEGSNSETHDKIRGAGSFKSALRGIALLAENGLAKQTRVSLTETEDNFQEIPALLKLLHSLGIGQFASGTLVHGGRAAKESGNGLKPPTPLQYEKILDRFHTDPTFKEHYGKMANIAPLEWYLGKATPSSVQGCEFMKNPYITAAGTLFPCVMFQIDKYAAHDVYSRPIAETLRNIIPLWALLQQQSRYRSYLRTCRACPGRSHCRGGCMGRAYMAHGSLRTAEDRCSLRKVVYNWTGCGKSVPKSKA